MRLVYRPLPPVWPSGQRTPVAGRRRSPFKASWPNTLELLEHELRQLGVHSGDTVVVEAGFQEHEIRLDGYPRANARPRDPAVILSFESRWGPLRYGCDTYEDHQANVRGIALSLEALRAVDRHGVTKRGEQYQGWKALPPSGEGEMSKAEAETFIRHHGDGLAGEVRVGTVRDAYRRAAKRLHPDIGGDPTEWAKLDRARQVLDL